MQAGESDSRTAGTVSVIIPVFNRKTLILETLESVRAQTYADIEVVVTDDGSTDGTPEAVRAWIGTAGDSRFRLLALPRNGGKSAAVNAALQMFRGAYVTVLDSDDLLLPDAVSRQVEFLNRCRDAGMVAGKALILRGTTQTRETLGGFEGVHECPDLAALYGDLLLNGNPIVASTVLLRADVVREIGGFNTRLIFTHDWEYWIRVAARYRIGFIGVPILYYRVEHAGSSSRNRVGTFEEICDLLLHADPPRGKEGVLRALIYQVKYNLGLAYHDGDAGAFLSIACTGLRKVGGAFFFHTAS